MNVLARRRAAVIAAIAAFSLAVAWVVADAGEARADDTYSISGTVTLPAGAPQEYLKGVTVAAFKESGPGPGVFKTAKPSQVDGTYQISALPPGTYSVTFLIGSYASGDTLYTPNLVQELYDGKYTQPSYTPVQLAVADVAGIDASLEWGGTIGGKVTLAADVPSAWLAGVVVYAQTDGGTQYSASVDPATGAYSLTNLPAGSYVVRFANGTYADGVTLAYTDFYGEYYNDVYIYEDAKLVTVASHGTATGINAQLSTKAHFTKAPKPTIKHLSLAAGATLGSTTGVWAPAPTTFAFQWYRNGVKIAGATGQQYLLKKADRGTKITLKVTSSRDRFTTLTRTSAALAIPKIFTKAPKPTISGTAKAGKTLTAKPGTWAPKASVKYQWLRGGKAISGATKSTYKLKSADKGKKIAVKVTGKKSGYLTTAKTSKAKTVAK